MADTTKEMLQEYVDVIAKDLIDLEDNGFYYTEDYGYDEDTNYFYDNFNEDYIIRRGYGLMGVRVMVACGGPNIWIDSFLEEVHGYWGSDEAVAPIPRHTADAITALFEEWSAGCFENFM